MQLSWLQPGGTGSSRKPRLLGLAATALVLLASLIPPLVSHHTPITDDVERLLHDFYATTLADRVGQDPDIRILYYNDQVALETGKTSPIDRAILAKAIAAVDAAGAKAIGIDFFFAQTTDDQAQLTDVLSSISAPTTIVYADPDRDGGQFWDPAIADDSIRAQDGFWNAIGNPRVRRSAAKIGVGSDRVARSWPVRDDKAQLPFAAAVAGFEEGSGFGYEGSIAFTRLAQIRDRSNDTNTRGMFPAFAISSLADPRFAEARAEQMRGKYVLIGLNMFRADRLATPITRMVGEESLPGVEVHAHMLRQLLDQDYRKPVPIWLIVLVALVLALAAAASAQLDRRYVVQGTAIIAQIAILALLPIALHYAGYDLLEVPVAGWAIGWLLVIFGSGYLARQRTSRERAFAQGALGKYLPETVAREILADPDKLSLEGEERVLTMLFTDLEGFTRISHSQPPRTTARILNHYLDEMSEIILAHQGTIDKYVGDAIVAFWGAPFASDKDSVNAVACALALDECAERLRGELADQGEQLGRTRIGLHRGAVIVGNFGGRQRIQYTALGDAMNTAARLEGANKYLGSSILVSEAVREAAGDFDYLPLGEIVLSGVDTPIPVFEPVRDGILADLVRKALSGDAQSRAKLDEISDPPGAIEKLLERWDIVAGEKPYVLGSK
uniref:CHASE2 domain-containing protein n=1 Tax=Parerythrobacter lutipelagi TaxID=1964208 RepID=UPI0010F9AE9D|nr:CHASE2 domain-containing protein [Parerythrobacter lutipelagi]